MSEDRCVKCGRFLPYVGEDSQGEGGWNEVEHYGPCVNCNKITGEE